MLADDGLILPPCKRPPRSRTDELLHDIINLADEAARLALGENGEETEDEDFM